MFIFSSKSLVLVASGCKKYFTPIQMALIPADKVTVNISTITAALTLDSHFII